MSRRLQQLHRNERGNIMLLGLAAVGFMLVPMLAVLIYTSKTTVASVTADGLALSSANAGLTRSLDGRVSESYAQPQLYDPTSPAAEAAARETGQATALAWQVAQGQSLSSAGASLQMVAPQVTPGAPRSGPVSATAEADTVGVLNIFNIAGDPASSQATVNSVSAGNGCRSSSGLLFRSVLGSATPQLLCWVDQNARNDQGQLANRNPGLHTGIAGSNQQWDHYTSGVETLLRLSVPDLIGNGALQSTYRGVATVSQPCSDPDPTDSVNTCSQ